MSAKETFLNAIRTAAGKDDEALGLVRSVEERGEAVCLTRHIPETLRSISEEEYRARAAETEPLLLELGLGALPASYEEFLSELEKVNGARGKVANYRMHLPDAWDPDGLAVCPVEEEAMPHWLPGENLAAYGEQAILGTKGKSLLSRYVVFTTQPCTELWLGLACLHAVHGWRAAVEHGGRSPGMDRDAVARLMGEKRAFDPAVIARQIDAFRFAARLLHKASGGLLFPMIDTYTGGAFTGLEDIERFIAFAIGNLESVSSPPASLLEEKWRKHFVMHVGFTRFLPNEALLALYGSPEAAGRPEKPYLTSV
jgi:hypothetical protein